MVVILSLLQKFALLSLERERSASYLFPFQKGSHQEVFIITHCGDLGLKIAFNLLNELGLHLLRLRQWFDAFQHVERICYHNYIYTNILTGFWGCICCF